MTKKTVHTIFLTSLSTAVCSVVFAVLALYQYQRTAIQLTSHLRSVSVTAPIRLAFNLEVDNKLKYKISPAAAGIWSSESGLFGVKALTFMPTKPLTPGSSYTIELENVHKLGLTTSSGSMSIPISTQLPATIESITPADSSGNIAVNPVFKIKLTTVNNKLRQLRLTSDMNEILVADTSVDDKTFTWHSATPLDQGKTYHLYLDDLNQPDHSKQRLAATSFNTVSEPKIISATSSDHFYPGDTITVIYDQPMDPHSLPDTSMQGTGHYSDPTKYIFTPTGLKPGTTYTYKLAKGQSSIVGGLIQSDHIYTISPPGNTMVLSSAPTSNNVAVNTTIITNFDQPVDHTSAEANFSLLPSSPGTFSWLGNSMVYHPAALAYQTFYIVSLNPGINSTFGLPSVKAFRFNFTTTYQIIKLNVPGYHQQYTQSCEEAALRMVLAYRGVAVTDMDVLLRVGYNPRARDEATNTWDNPYQMFVGDVNGMQPTTGYGVFSPPIASAARSFGRTAIAATNVSSDWVASQIIAGNPVIAWGHSSGQRPDSWNTSSGVIQAYVAEHVRTIYGVAGKPGAVIGFYIHDPIYGDLYWSPSQLMSNMNAFGSTSNQAVVVY